MLSLAASTPMPTPSSPQIVVEKNGTRTTTYNATVAQPSALCIAAFPHPDDGDREAWEKMPEGDADIKGLRCDKACNQNVVAELAIVLALRKRVQLRLELSRGSAPWSRRSTVGC